MRTLSLAVWSALVLQAGAAVVRVTTNFELIAAVENVLAGDEIVVAAGTYFSPTMPKSFVNEAHLTITTAGTPNNRIILRGEDPDNPPTILGADVSYWSVIRLSDGADYWAIQDLILSTADKGVVVDNSNFVDLKRLQIHTIGEEGIHVRDGARHTLIEDCQISNTGLVYPGFGEGIYVGSDRDVWDYFSPDVAFTTVRRCIIGPYVRGEAFDVKEGTSDTVIEYCTVDATGLSGENFADSFIDIKGSRTFVRFNTFNRKESSALKKGIAVIDREVTLSADRNAIHDNVFNLDGDPSIKMIEAGDRTSETIAFDNTRDATGGSDYSGSISKSCCPDWYDLPIESTPTLPQPPKRTPNPTASSTPDPSPNPSTPPTSEPSPSPSPKPTPKPSIEPSPNPSPKPSRNPSMKPSPIPSPNPSSKPFAKPSSEPTPSPSRKPPSREPTPEPSTKPTGEPSTKPSREPTPRPSSTPTSSEPTPEPSTKPTGEPSAKPSREPTPRPSSTPTARSSSAPTPRPSSTPTPRPSSTPTLRPSSTPTLRPSSTPTSRPSSTPTPRPSSSPTPLPSSRPSSTPADAPLPVTTTPTPIPLTGGFCDDSDFDTFFVKSIGELQRCVWLAARPEFLEEVCSSSTGAATCPELCGVCKDNCDDTDGKFRVGDDMRDCLWLRLRPEKKLEICLPGSDAERVCPETCDFCDSPGPGNAPPSRSPTPPPAPLGYYCDDDKTKTFHVEETQELQRCVWLAARPEYMLTYCEENHPSKAYFICEETCGKCVDDCDDTSAAVEVDGKARDCLWLSLRPEMQSVLCLPLEPAFVLCPETCDVCDGTGTLAPAAAPPPTAPMKGCDDALLDEFFVAELGEFQRCVWISARPDWQASLCAENDRSHAREICPETCGACKDRCRDTDAKFLVGESLRDCLWLSLRPMFHDELCAAEEVKKSCPETCNICDV